MVNEIPLTKEERAWLREELARFVAAKSLCPPLSQKQLEELAEEFISKTNYKAPSPVGEGRNGVVGDFVLVEIHNQLWKDTVARIPHERRLLLLPKCLSRHGHCKGEYDEFGLLCHRCGSCLIPSLQDEADRLGVLSLVAEGFTQVIELIESQVIDAVIGVSCLDSLEKAFPLLVRHAVPGLAIPLNDSGCRDTHVDDDYVRQLMAMEAAPGSGELTLLNHKEIRRSVEGWFAPEELSRTLSPADDLTSRVALDWMSGEGHRWRPYLVAAVYQALAGAEMTDDVRRAAVAVECFHKASLIHDDIQDGDLTRYDRPTVNARYGDAWAINAGDYLLGEGYRLLSQSGEPALLRTIAEAHVELCKGQGAELTWRANPVPLTLDAVLEVIAKKTVPAFEAALQLGLLCAHSPLDLHDYSRALGIAYQLKDDLGDIATGEPFSAIAALQSEHPQWTQDEIEAEMQRLIDDYHRQALDAIKDINGLELKRLLFQVTEKILKQ